MIDRGGRLGRSSRRRRGLPPLCATLAVLATGASNTAGQSPPANASVSAAVPYDPDRASSTPLADSARSPARPALGLRRELTLLAVGGDLRLAAMLVPSPARRIPREGLDPEGIPLSFDRSVVGRSSASAASASDRTRAATLTLPLLVGFLTAPPRHRWNGLGRTALVYAEAAVLADGLTILGKRAIGRARPFAYEPKAGNAAWGTGPASPTTFFSLPSGHSSSAWTGATVAVTEHLLQRPEAGWLERGAVGFLAGGLAGATSALRVEGGVHFPSDVVAGAGIGVLSGVAIPLAHRGDREMPSARSWLTAAGGVLAGVAVGVALAGTY